MAQRVRNTQILLARVIKDEPRASNSLTWSTPDPPRFNPWNTHNLWGESRLNYVPLSAEAQGLVVCCYTGGIIGVYGFSGVSKEFNAFVNSTNQRLVTEEKYWLYLPINAGEFCGSGKSFVINQSAITRVPY